MFFAGKTEETVRRVVEAWPMGRLGETSDISPVVGFLAGDSSEWVNGQTIRVNGGLCKGTKSTVVCVLSNQNI